jgi:NAD(P)-dependent dehydrogenase (short-subunit alcohol dehydrogenase family)
VRDVLVVIGTGGMGLAVARRLGSGRKVLLADYSETRLAEVMAQLHDEGQDVHCRPLDITDRDAVAAFAGHSAEYGRLAAIVHTAGVSPAMASSRDIYRVDLVGASHVIDEFRAVAGAGCALTCIASMAGYRQPVSAAIEALLARTPTAQLLSLTELDVDGPDTRNAYHLAKRGLQLRVQTAAMAWGTRGARINSVSPGIVATAMGRYELDGPNGERMRGLLAASPVPRQGTADDIAAAVAFLTEASFVTGTDLLIDGGATALQRWP